MQMSGCELICGSREFARRSAMCPKVNQCYRVKYFLLLKLAEGNSRLFILISRGYGQKGQVKRQTAMVGGQRWSVRACACGTSPWSCSHQSSSVIPISVHPKQHRCRQVCDSPFPGSLSYGSPRQLDLSQPWPSARSSL